MSVESRYDILLQPIAIGPVTARNRFYQVPHCTGMGYRDPTALAHMRGVKAEGGWAVVCTEQVEIHWTSEITPFIELRLWDDRDIPMLARMADHIHAHGALAGLELCYNGLHGPNFYSREVPMAPTGRTIASFTYEPLQARTMDKEDIRNVRRWHKAAALRARRAGYDLIYVYAGHGLSFLHHFLSREFNHRTDEYGGSLENRVRLLKELLIDTKEAVGDSCAVPCRLSMDELRGADGLEKAETEDMIGLVAEIPDLWDVCLAGWENDSQSSRFGEEGGQEPFIEGVKKLTTKPVVGVGRYTSPDRMVSIVKKGIVDLIGCARPSIADPFLPRKVAEGRLEDIRECIGCNICVSGDFTMSPIRCTQNPTMGEEWRRGWHPEFIRPKESEKPVLIVGAGPAGLEAAQALGKRGYDVTLAEQSRELGGRVARECRLPGLAAWGRVRDYRVEQLRKLPNVALYLESQLDAETVLEFGCPRVVIATGARWRSDGVGHHWTAPLPIEDGSQVLTPDDLMEGSLARGNARRRLGRRSLLHGRRAGRALGRQGLSDHIHDARVGGLHLEPQHHGAALRPGAHAGERNSHRGVPDPEPYFPGHRRDVMRPYRPGRGAGGRCGGSRHQPNTVGRDRGRSIAATGPLAGRRPRSRGSHRRRARAGDHRPCRLRRAALRRRPRRRGRSNGRGALQARDRRADRVILLAGEQRPME